MCSKQLVEALYNYGLENNLRYCSNHYLKHCTAMVQTTIWNPGHFLHRHYFRRCKSLVPRTTLALYISDQTWHNAHLWSQNKVEAFYISGYSNALKHCTPLIIANNWDTIYLWFQQLPKEIYISGSRNYPRNGTCLFPANMRNCKSLVQANTWDTVQHCSRQQLKTLYFMIQATTW